MKKVKFLYDKVMEITGQVGKDHVGAYAAQAAYFFMLSMIPIILLLITLVQYTPVTKADVMTAVLQVFPKSVDSLITSIVNQVYNQSGGIISLTIIVALWSAGKGVLALTTGLNCVYDCKETRNYIILRIRATFYTVAFIIVIIFLLVLSVFGNTLNLFVTEHYPVMERLVDQIMRIRGIITPVLLFVFTMMIYKFLPNHIVQLRDVITVGIFSAIYFVINFAFMLLGGLHPLLWILMPGFIALFTGIPYLMMCAKVQKVGSVLLMGLITGLIYYVTGQFTVVILVSFVLACGLAELTRGLTHYRSMAGNLVSFVLFSVGMVGSPLPIWLMRDEFLQQITEQGMPADYVNTLAALSSNVMLVVLFLAPVVGAIIGGFIARAMFRKHFEKAGLV